MKPAATPELMVVMPVYNEQASVRKVVREWMEEIENWTENFVFLAINDGSTDETLNILKRLRGQMGERLEILDQANRGHGQTCLRGYRIACERQIPWILQIDSDGQCDPQYFFKLWNRREEFDVLYGRRSRRLDGWKRVLVSQILRVVLVLSTGAWCADANSPYRLMRSGTLPRHVGRIPEDFFLANVALAVLLRRDPEIRQGEVPIIFRERYGGEPTVPLGKFGDKASQLITQLRRIPDGAAGTGN